MFVTFEGCDGVGKSTQLRFLKEYLASTGQKALFIHEPGSTDISEAIRSLILDPTHTEMTAETEALLYAAARAQLIKQVILPALERGETVICDRYIDSSIAYQGYARGLGADFVNEINIVAVQQAMPDVTIFIDLHPASSFRSSRQNDRLENEKDEFHSKVYEGYIAQAEVSKDRIVVIKPDFDKNITHKRIIGALREKGVLR